MGQGFFKHSCCTLVISAQARHIRQTAKRPGHQVVIPQLSGEAQTLFPACGGALNISHPEPRIAQPDECVGNPPALSNCPKQAQTLFERLYCLLSLAFKLKGRAQINKCQAYASSVSNFSI